MCVSTKILMALCKVLYTMPSGKGEEVINANKTLIMV